MRRPKQSGGGILRRALGDDRGQSAIEYLGLIVFSALLVLAIAAASPELRAAATDATQRAACTLQGSTDCEDSDGATEGEVRDLSPRVDPEAPRPELSEAETLGNAGSLGAGGSNQLVGFDPGSPGGSADDEPVVTSPSCDEGFEAQSESQKKFLNGDSMRCQNGLPVLDLNLNGIDDNRERELFCQAGLCPNYDFNDNGIPDSQEPGEFEYLTPEFKCSGDGLGDPVTGFLSPDQYCRTTQPLYRPGQPGVVCKEVEGDDGIDLECKPEERILEQLEDVVASTDDPPQTLGEALLRAGGLSPEQARLAATLGSLVNLSSALRSLDDAGDLLKKFGSGSRSARNADDYLAGLDTRPPPTTVAGRYQADKAGANELLMRGGGESIWADGFRASDGYVLEAKHVDNVARSPYVDGSNIPDPIRNRILQQFRGELERYKAVITDPTNPTQGLELITNNPAARSLLERELKNAGVPGRVVVRP